MSQYQFEEEDFSGSVSGRTLRRMLGLTLPHWRWLAGFLAMVTLVSILDSIFSYMKKLIIDQGVTPGDMPALLHIIAIYAGMALLQAGGVFGFISLAGLLGERLQYDLRQKMFDHLQDLSFSYFDRTPVGWIMSRVTSDPSRIAELITWGLLDVTWGAMSILAASAFMIFLNWRLGLIVFLSIPALVIVASRFQRRIILEFRNVRKVNSRITGAYNENISGIRVVKALNREEVNLDEFSGLTGQMYQSSFRAARLSAMFLPIVQFLSAIALGSVAWFGGAQVAWGTMTVGDLQAFIGYVTFMLWPVQDLARVYAELQHAVASAERTFALIDAKAEVVDREGARDPGTLRAPIEFDHVSFWYQQGKPVLQDVSLRVEPGESIALVGATGGGKTTLVNLLCRFYEPKEGVVRIGGHDYTEWTLPGIQSRIGVVLQTPHLFSGSVKENIRYGRLNATDGEIERAAQIAGAHEFVGGLAKGYDSEVGEGGNLLSVGQKQLISLARAVLADPDILIMDEATSSVDTLTEALIQRGMERLMRGRTSFVIAHRLSTIRHADRIAVIENGKISELGTHSQLLHERGHYYELYTRQFRRELESEYGIAALTGWAEPASA